MRIVIIIATLFINLAIYAQEIGDVTRTDNGYTKVYDINNKIIASGYTDDNNYDWDFSSCIIVLRKDNGYTKVYDSKLKLISSGYTEGKDYSFKVSGCNIILKNKNGYKKIYDKKLKIKTSGY
jgi:hypothetical protein